MQPPYVPPPPPEPRDNNTTIIVVAVVIAVLFLGGLVVAAAGAAFYFSSRGSSRPPRPRPTATATATAVATTTPPPSTCGECSWAGTGCIAGVCRLLPGQLWAVRPKQIVMQGLSSGANNATTRVCLQPPGGAGRCTTEFRMPAMNTSGKHLLAFSRATAAGAEILLRSEDLTSAGFNATIELNRTRNHHNPTLRHLDGIRAGRLLFEGGLRFSGVGNTESITVDLEAR